MIRLVRQHPVRHLDMTPLLDVVFILLIFFLLTSSFTRTGEINLALPAANVDAQVRELPPIMLSVDASGNIYDGEEQVSAEMLEPWLQAHFRKTPQAALAIHADRGLSIDHLVRVMDTARAVGFDKVALATERLQP